MKKVVFFSAFLLGSLLFHSCREDASFDETLLYGRWRSGTLHYRYMPDHTGYYWDTKDDVSESEAQNFTWQLEKSKLQHIHKMEIGGGLIPENCTVTELTITTLKYNDGYKSYAFAKVD
jgi:hypothetical protein